MTTATIPENLPGLYLKDRRSRLDPDAFGFPTQRRRTPACDARKRRSAPTSARPGTLGSNRGGAPSPDVLNRIAGGLILTEAEREHLFMLAHGRPPEVRYKAIDSVTPRLQRLLDALVTSPAIVKTATWDVVA